MLRRAPWYGISLAIHLLLLLVLSLVAVERRRTAASPRLTVRLDEGEAPVERRLEYEPDLAIESPEEVMPEDDEPAAEAPAAPASDDRPPALDPPDLSHRIPRIGLSGTPIRGDIESAQKEAARAAGGAGGLAGLSPDRILVRASARGLDSIEDILALHGIPHTVVKSLRGRRLSPRQVLFLNCDQRPLGFDPAELRAFVRAGGWVMSSDWGLDHFLAPAFPELVRVTPPRKPQNRDVVVAIRPAAKGHFLLEGVFPARGEDVRWWLEPVSSFFRVDPERVDVLVESDELGERFGSSAVAFTARVGEGRVAHVLGHFYQQQGNMEGLTGMHRLLLNFLRAAVS